MSVAAADVVGADGQAGLPLEAMPGAACLQLLQILLELLMNEIKAETKKHLMMQLQMAAAAATGSARVAKPDASIARPLKQVKQMIRAVHRMRLMTDFPKQLLAAADLSALWAGAAAGSSLAAFALGGATAGTAVAGGSMREQCMQYREQYNNADLPKAAAAGVDPSLQSPKGLQPCWQYYGLEGKTSEAATTGRMDSASSPTAPNADPSAAGRHAEAAAGAAGQPASVRAQDALQHLGCFPLSLIAACMQQLEHMPAELPLMALQVLWDARRLLNSCDLLQAGLPLLQQQEQLCMHLYMQQLVPTAYEHFKVGALGT
jgi:hypothetical protein